MIPALQTIAAAMSAAALGAQNPRPNLILIMADDVGVEAFGCYGGESYSTPNVDRLAERGLRFTHCHSQPVCTPTRVKLMTGKSNARNYVAFGVLRPGERTFAQVLREVGYATAVSGKWQLYGAEHYPESLRATGTLPAEAGFDTHCLWQVAELGSRYWGPELDRDGEVEVLGADRYGPDVFTDHLLEFVAEHEAGPFLAYFPMALVHSPFVPTPAVDDGDRKRDRRHFGAMMAHLDAIVGRIVARVTELGIAERTLILFTSDNGTNRSIRSKQSGRTVRGAKNQTIDAGTHVPLIAYWPGTVRAGVCSDLIDFSDFLPTLAAVAGAELDDDEIDGVSFAPQLRGERGTPRRVSTCYFHPRPRTRPRSKPIRFARTKRYKLYASGELFDTGTDPLEQRPLVKGDRDSAGVRAELQAALDAMPRR